jgi:hypothetical protein
MKAIFFNFLGREVLIDSRDKQAIKTIGRCRLLPRIIKESCNEYEVHWCCTRITISKAAQTSRKFI